MAVLPPGRAVPTAMTAGLPAALAAKAVSRASSAAGGEVVLVAGQLAVPRRPGAGTPARPAAASSSARSSPGIEPEGIDIAFSVRRCGLRRCPVSMIR